MRGVFNIYGWVTFFLVILQIEKGREIFKLRHVKFLRFMTSHSVILVACKILSDQIEKKSSQRWVEKITVF